MVLYTHTVIVLTHWCSQCVKCSPTKHTGTSLVILRHMHKKSTGLVIPVYTKLADFTSHMYTNQVHLLPITYMYAVIKLFNV